MNLPADVECIEDASLFIWRPHGVLNEAMVNKILTFVADQEKSLVGHSIDLLTCPR